MSDTSAINMINLQVWAEELAKTDKRNGTYAINTATDSKYYLWHSEFQTIPLGMDGNPEQFAAKLREALPSVNSLRLPFNEFSFDANGQLHEQYDRFLQAAADEGFQILLVYSSGAIQRFGKGLKDPDQIEAGLNGQVLDGATKGWESMLDWLDAHPSVQDAIWGLEVANEPAAYLNGDRIVDDARFVELYAKHVIQLGQMIDARSDAKILVGGFRYSARFDDLEAGDINGLNALDAIRQAFGDDLVWSAHLYPGWVKSDGDTDLLKERLDAFYAPVLGDAILVTETNATGGAVDNPTESNGDVATYIKTWEWFADNGIGASWFPGAETGASNFVVVHADGSLRFLHQGSLAHGMNLYTLGEEPADRAGDETLTTDLIAGDVRNERHDVDGMTFDEDIDGIAFGFGYGGNDTILGQDRANDLIYGGSGNDVLTGLAGDDHLFGQDGDDRLTGGAGNDVLMGGRGNDTLSSGDGRDIMTGGDGSDLFVIEGTGDVDIFDFDVTEGDLLSIQGHILTRDELANTGRGVAVHADGIANDLAIEMSGGTVVLHDFLDDNAAAIGRDPVTPPTLEFEATEGNDSVDARESGGALDFDAGEGNDTVIGTNYGDNLSGGRGNDLLRGADGDDSMTAFRGNDALYGEDGNDTVDLGQQSSFGDGGAGDDHLFLNLLKGAKHRITGGDGQDVFEVIVNGVERSGSVCFTDYDVRTETLLIDGRTLPDFLATLVDPRSAFSVDGTDLILELGQTNTLVFESADIAAFETALDLSIVGRPAITNIFTPCGEVRNDRAVNQDGLLAFSGSSTADELRGTGTGDVIYAKNGNDTVYAGAGDDTIIASAGNNFLSGEDGNDRIVSGYHSSTIEGGAGDDIIELNLSRGADHVASGGSGADTFVFRGANDRISVVTITDFEPGVDHIDLAPAYADYELIQNGADLVLGFSTGDSLTLNGLTIEAWLGVL